MIGVPEPIIQIIHIPTDHRPVGFHPFDERVELCDDPVQRVDAVVYGDSAGFLLHIPEEVYNIAQDLSRYIQQPIPEFLHISKEFLYRLQSFRLFDKFSDCVVGFYDFLTDISEEIVKDVSFPQTLREVRDFGPQLPGFLQDKVDKIRNPL